MKRFEAIKEINSHLTDELIVCNIGFPSRELYEIEDRAENFYMLGSMGLASSIGLGIALSSDKKTIVLDGDGAFLMNMGSLATVFNQNPENLIWIVLDNSCYGSTGNQKTYCNTINLLEVAKSVGFLKAYDYNEISFEDVLKEKGPHFIHFKIEAGNEKVGIIPLEPEEIKYRFMDVIKNK